MPYPKPLSLAAYLGMVDRLQVTFMPVFLKHESHNNFSFWDFKFLKFTQLFSKLWRSDFSNFRPEIEKANEFEKLHLIIFSFDFNQSPSFISIHSSHSLFHPLPPTLYLSLSLISRHTSFDLTSLSLFLILFPSIFLFLPSLPFLSLYLPH